MASDKLDSGISRTRQKIEEAMAKAEKEKLFKSAKRRLEVAMAGVKANEEHKYIEAVQNYHAYLRVLEEVKGVGEGALQPSLFDMKNEVGEVLLLVGVYWDLAKIYDRTKTANKYPEFKSYLDKFMLFSRGFPHEPMARELLRKYIRREKPRHSAEFRAAYKTVAKDKCFIATSLVDEIEEETMPRLRSFRDERLARSRGGRGVIGVYYALGPWVAAFLDWSPALLRQVCGRALDGLARLVG